MKVARWKLLLPLALLVAGGVLASSGALATAASGGEVKVAIMTDCKGAFAFGYEVDTAGTIAAFSQYAGAKPKNKKKPTAGMTGGSAGGALAVRRAGKDLRRGRPSWGPASLMRPAEDRARRNVRVLCRYVADRTEDATIIAAL